MLILLDFDSCIVSCPSTRSHYPIHPVHQSNTIHHSRHESHRSETQTTKRDEQPIPFGFRSHLFTRSLTRHYTPVLSTNLIHYPFHPFILSTINHHHLLAPSSTSITTYSKSILPRYPLASSPHLTPRAKLALRESTTIHDHDHNHKEARNDSPSTTWFFSS